MIQVRWKDATPADLVEVARALVDALPLFPFWSTIESMSPSPPEPRARTSAGTTSRWHRSVPTSRRNSCSISVGSADEAARAALIPADYWSIGPCFATPSKRDAGPALGPAGFGAIARLAPEGVPVIGIGGITAATAPQIIAAGAVGVAVIGAVLSAPDPETAARALAAAARA